jgi:pathogenesis-related protein 1
MTRLPLPRCLTGWLLRWMVTAVCLAGWAGLAPAAELDAAQRREALAAHNRWRARVGVSPLVWSEALAQSAARWAVQLDPGVPGGVCRMEHSDTPDFGENLYWASAVQWSNGQRTTQEVLPAFVVDVWGNESADYRADSGFCRPGRTCGHYTQIVWKDTREVGCALRVCGAKDQVWVCQYRPAGNYIGQRPY